MAVRDNQLRFSFDIKTEADGSTVAPTEQIISNAAFRVAGILHTNDHPKGSLLFYFDRRHLGMSLQNYSHSGEPGAYPIEFDIASNLSTNSQTPGVWYGFLICYDLRSLSIMVTNASGTCMFSNTFWRDNITDHLGKGGVSKKLWTNGSNYVRNATLHQRSMKIPLKTLKYEWQGAIGNKSRDRSGPTVHSSFWSPLKMISKGNDAFWTGGFNEGRTEIHKFNVSTAGVVTLNFGRFSAPSPSDPYPADIAFNSDWTRILVKYAVDGKVFSFDLNDGSGTETNLTFPGSATVGFTVPAGNTIATNPEDRNIAAVYYTNTEQVIIYGNAQSATPTTNWIIGMMNGYSNGPAIFEPDNTHEYRTNQLKLCSYYFDPNGNPTPDHRVSIPAVCFQSDGKVWVGDAATSRLLRFHTTGTQAGKFDTLIQYVAHTYTACVDSSPLGKIGPSWGISNSK